MEKINKAADRSTLTPRTLIAVLIFLALMVIARPAAAACSKASLKGTYGIEWGWPQALYDGNQNEAIVLGQITADGKGNLTGQQTVSFLNTIGTASISPLPQTAPAHSLSAAAPTMLLIFI